MTRDEMKRAIRECPTFLYSTSPQNTEADRRWVFQDGTFTPLDRAYLHVLELTAEAEAKASKQ